MDEEPYAPKAGKPADASFRERGRQTSSAPSCCAETATDILRQTGPEEAQPILSEAPLHPQQILGSAASGSVGDYRGEAASNDCTDEKPAQNGTAPAAAREERGQFSTALVLQDDMSSSVDDSGAALEHPESDASISGALRLKPTQEGNHSPGTDTRRSVRSADQTGSDQGGPADAAVAHRAACSGTAEQELHCEEQDSAKNATGEARAAQQEVPLVQQPADGPELHEENDAAAVQDSAAVQEQGIGETVDVYRESQYTYDRQDKIDVGPAATQGQKMQNTSVLPIVSHGRSASQLLYREPDTARAAWYQLGPGPEAAALPAEPAGQQEREDACKPSIAAAPEEPLAGTDLERARRALSEKEPFGKLSEVPPAQQPNEEHAAGHPAEGDSLAPAAAATGGGAGSTRTQASDRPDTKQTAQPAAGSRGTHRKTERSVPAAPPAVPSAAAPQPPKTPQPLSDAAVTAHTASQWKYQAVPPSNIVPDSYDEYLRRHEEYPDSTVIGARVRGKKHKHEGTNSDDWFEVGSADGVTLIAVSDGAGSRRLSRIGARTACEASVAYMTDALTELASDKQQRGKLFSDLAIDVGRQDPAFNAALGTVVQIVQGAMLHAIESVTEVWKDRTENPRFADSKGSPPVLGDFAATLLLAAVVPIGGRRKVIVSCQVGDGMVAALDLQGALDQPTTARILGTPDSGAFSGETEFITSGASIAQSLNSRTAVCQGDVDLVLVMTDGVADDYFPGKTELPRLYFDLLANGILDEQPGRNVPDWAAAAEIPEPVSYPWVNNKTIEVPLQYASRIIEALGRPLKEIWSARTDIFPRAGKALADLPEDAAERLERWLDNYVERGSFDDRTLVIARLKGDDA